MKFANVHCILKNSTFWFE